jgi:hypothetical protein
MGKQLQVGARIFDLGLIEMFQQISNRTVSPGVQHRVGLHLQHPLWTRLGGEVGLGAKQITQQTASAVSSGELLAHD